MATKGERLLCNGCWEELAPGDPAFATTCSHLFCAPARWLTIAQDGRQVLRLGPVLQVLAACAPCSARRRAVPCARPI